MVILSMTSRTASLWQRCLTTSSMFLPTGTLLATRLPSLTLLSSICAGGAPSGLWRRPGDALLHQVRNCSCRLVQLLITRYINGHSDVIMGALLINSPDLYKKMFAVQVSREIIETMRISD